MKSSLATPLTTCLSEKVPGKAAADDQVLRPLTLPWETQRQFHGPCFELVQACPLLAFVKQTNKQTSKTVGFLSLSFLSLSPVSLFSLLSPALCNYISNKHTHTQTKHLRTIHIMISIVIVRLRGNCKRKAFSSDRRLWQTSPWWELAQDHFYMAGWVCEIHSTGPLHVLGMGDGLHRLVTCSKWPTARGAGLKQGWLVPGAPQTFHGRWARMVLCRFTHSASGQHPTLPDVRLMQDEELTVTHLVLL